MARDPLKESQQDLVKALADLEGTRMTPPDDLRLSELKDNIRRAMKSRRRESVHHQFPNNSAR
jgi:hypothetical protein